MEIAATPMPEPYQNKMVSALSLSPVDLIPTQLSINPTNWDQFMGPLFIN